mgnify:CR=1 FL=1
MSFSLNEYKINKLNENLIQLAITKLPSNYLCLFLEDEEEVDAESAGDDVFEFSASQFLPKLSLILKLSPSSYVSTST